MDESVKRALAKWPNVPDCYDWLKLSRRGQWVMRAPDAEPPVWGPVLNNKLIDYINRNYLQDENGSYFFQNGPQKVRVELEFTPYVFQVPGGELSEFTLESHTHERSTDIKGAWIDETGSLVFKTSVGFGVLDDRDLSLALPWMKDASGASLDDDELVSRFDKFMAGQSGQLTISDVQIKPIESSSLAEIEGYVQVPVKP